jgi:hypothetical protein
MTMALAAAMVPQAGRAAEHHQSEGQVGPPATHPLRRPRPGQDKPRHQGRRGQEGQAVEHEQVRGRENEQGNPGDQGAGQGLQVLGEAGIGQGLGIGRLVGQNIGQGGLEGGREPRRTGVDQKDQQVDLPHGVDEG